MTSVSEDMSKLSTNHRSQPLIQCHHLRHARLFAVSDEEAGISCVDAAHHPLSEVSEAQDVGRIGLVHHSAPGHVASIVHCTGSSLPPDRVLGTGGRANLLLMAWSYYRLHRAFADSFGITHLRV